MISSFNPRCLPSWDLRTLGEKELDLTFDENWWREVLTRINTTCI